jgi:hypothetical protein
LIQRLMCLYGGPGQKSWDYSASGPEGTLNHRIKILSPPLLTSYFSTSNATHTEELDEGFQPINWYEASRIALAFDILPGRILTVYKAI